MQHWLLPPMFGGLKKRVLAGLEVQAAEVHGGDAPPRGAAPGTGSPGLTYPVDGIRNTYPRLPPPAAENTMVFNLSVT